MKLVIQRVSRGVVKVEDKVVGSIERGLFILVGVGADDTAEQANKLAEKVIKMRLMKDENGPPATQGELARPLRAGKMNLTAADVGGSYLVVSQFTLYADTSGGNRPSFVNAASPDKAREIYERFVTRLRELGAEVATGSFGEYMEIDLTLDGPVTIIIEG